MALRGSLRILDNLQLYLYRIWLAEPSRPRSGPIATIQHP